MTTKTNSQFQFFFSPSHFAPYASYCQRIPPTFFFVWCVSAGVSAFLFVSSSLFLWNLWPPVDWCTSDRRAWNNTVYSSVASARIFFSCSSLLPFKKGGEKRNAVSKRQTTLVVPCFLLLLKWCAFATDSSLLCLPAVCFFCVKCSYSRSRQTPMKTHRPATSAPAKVKAVTHDSMRAGCPPVSCLSPACAPAATAGLCDDLNYSE